MEASMDATMATVSSDLKDDPNAVVSSKDVVVKSIAEEKDEAEEAEAAEAAKKAAANPTTKKEPDPGKKPEPKADPKPAAGDETDPVDKLRLGKHADAKAKSDWKTLQTIAKDRATALKAAQKELADAKAAAESGTAASDALKAANAEIERLQKIEFVHSPETSAIVARDFNAKLDGMEAKTIEMLKSLDPQAAENLEKGGFEGQKLGKKWTQDGWLVSIKGMLQSKKITESQAAKLTKQVNDYFDTKDEKAEAIAKAAEEYKSAPELMQKTRAASEKRYNDDLSGEYDKLYSDFIKKPENAWAIFQQEIPAGTSPEERARIEANNKYLDEELKPVLHKAVGIKTPQDHAWYAFRVALAHHLENRALPEANKRIESLEAELAKAKGETTKIKSAARVGKLASTHTAPTRRPAANGINSTAESNMDAALGITR
jgi:hypothetical protein